MISRRNQKHLIAHGLMPRMIPLSRGLHFGGGAVRCLADHLAASPPPPPGAATDRGVDTLLLSVLPTADTDSGESASSEYSVARADSWSWSPDTGRAGDTLGNTISRELPTCSSSDRDRGTVSRLGPRLARAGCSHELAISLCLGWVDSGLWRRSEVESSLASPDTGSGASWLSNVPRSIHDYSRGGGEEAEQPRAEAARWM